MPKEKQTDLKITYQVKCGNNVIQKKEKTTFDTFSEAFELAKAFKENPRVYNPRMKDESFEYWKVRNYDVVQITTIETKLISTT